jgi:hypothetical protein
MTAIPKRPVLLDRITDVVEAFALRAFLDAQGIPVHLSERPLAMALGEIPFFEAAAELVLDDPARLAEARELIERYRSGYVGVRGTAWRCEHCGERHEPQFGACWRCGTMRPRGPRFRRPRTDAHARRPKP